MSLSQQRYQQVLKRIADACAEAGRDPARVELLAVSKAQPLERIATLAACGHGSFAENYAQELVAKVRMCADNPALSGLSWRFIGTLQSNKIKTLVAHCDEIQTLASAKHARMIARIAAELGRQPYPVYIAVNAAQEPQKGGVSPAEVAALADTVNELPALELQGIMSVPPSRYSDSVCAEVPPLYRDLARLARQTGKGRLSLGMSRDLRIAIVAGADVVRVGRDLLGEREP